MILKLDFFKAFDTVEHDLILKLLHHKGFDSKWIGSSRELLSSGTSSVILNGVHGKQFTCKRGVRQGDPLSPLLFVLAADLLQTLVNNMLRNGVISLPIETHDPDFPIVQYADDTLLIVPAVDSQLLAVKEMLQDFHASTGLRVNFHKSCILPINVDEAETARLASVFGCQVGTLPFTYLGLPVGTTKPRIQDLFPVVDRVERRLSASSSLLNQGARLQLLQSVLSSLPIYFLCSLCLPAGIIKQIERIMRQCLWRGNSDTPRQSLAAWPLVCRPKDKGGMGIVNPTIQNRALLSKHLSKFYNKADIPWVSLIWNTYYDGVVPHGTVLCGSYWWRDILKLNEVFRLHSEVTINMGDSVLFWFDAWVFLGSSVPLRERFPRLFSFAIDDKVSVREVINTPDMSELFHLPLSPEAMDEMITVQSGLLDLNDDEEIHDSWSWTPGKGIFSAKSYYTVMHAHMATDTPAKWIWESKATMKIKVFAWLMLNDRLNIGICWSGGTGDRLRRTTLAPYVMLKPMRTEIIYFSPVNSAQGSGIICKFSG